MYRQFPETRLRVKTIYDQNSRVESAIQKHFRRTSMSSLKPQDNSYANQRANLLRHKRKISLQKTSVENLALFERINRQKSVINFGKPEQHQKKSSLKSLFFCTGKQNIDESKLDRMIQRRKGDIDRVLKSTRHKILMF